MFDMFKEYVWSKHIVRLAIEVRSVDIIKWLILVSHGVLLLTFVTFHVSTAILCLLCLLISAAVMLAVTWNGKTHN